MMPMTRRGAVVPAKWSSTSTSRKESTSVPADSSDDQPPLQLVVAPGGSTIF
jgi:hypothetical protein